MSAFLLAVPGFSVTPETLLQHAQRKSWLHDNPSRVEKVRPVPSVEEEGWFPGSTSIGSLSPCSMFDAPMHMHVLFALVILRAHPKHPHCCRH